MAPEFRDRLLHALELNLPYVERLLLEGGRPAAVLVLFGASRERPQEFSLLVTRRTDSVGSHKGQMAFPGGMSESGEVGSFDGAVRTALRETQEEVGIPLNAVDVVGGLPELTTVTGFRVTPVVAFLRDFLEECALTPSAAEIAEALWVPLSTLLDPTVYRLEHRRVGEIDYPIHVYQVGSHRIWGATGSMIKNLLDRLKALG